LTVIKPGSTADECTIQTNERAGSMRHQDKIKLQRRRRRQLFWLFAAAAVCALLLEEQVAVLYVLSTLAICGLMMVIAFSNLEARDAEMQTAVIAEATDEMIKNSSDLNRSKRRAA
jgi:hypothetical protein